MESLEVKHPLIVRCSYSAQPAEQLIKSFLGKTSIQQPSHNSNHITSILDPQLNRYVFAFDLHMDDDDKGVKKDRQRTEVKVDLHSPQWMHGFDGRSFTYGWKFKISEDFKGSGDFCHIHQIKLFGKGEVAGLPKLTYTLRKDKLQIIIKDIGKVAQTQLNLIRGEWIEVIETVMYGKQGKLLIKMSRVKDNLELVSFKGDKLPISSEDSMIRPKWGIYRSLKKKQELKEERILFADQFIGQTLSDEKFNLK